MSGSFPRKGCVRRARAARVAAVLVVAGWITSLAACAGGDGETTTDAPGGTGASGGAAGAAIDAGGDASGATGGASGGGTGGASTGGSGNAGASSAGATGGTGGTGGASAGGSGGGCDQKDWEPNDSQATARPLTDITDCDDSGGSIDGTLAPGDVDWFTFKASDTTFCSVNPYVNVTSSDNVTVCMYFKCDSGTTAVTCPAGSQDWSASPTNPGCCASLTPLEPSVSCGGLFSNDSSQVWIDVSWEGNTSCRDYSLDYHY